MQIGTKLFLSLAAPILLLMALFGYLDQRYSSKILSEELAREGDVIARTVQVAVENALRDRQLEDVRQLVERMTGYQRILGVRIFDPSGELKHQSTSLQGKPFIDSDALQRVLRTRMPAHTHRKLDNEAVVNLIVPLSDPQGELLGAAQVLQLESFVEEDASASRKSVAMLTAVMIAATGVILFLATRFIVSLPAEELVRHFREVGSGDLQARVPVRHRDEFGRLAQEFNGMCERLQAAKQSLINEQEERRRVEASLRDAEHLASLGRFAAGLAHEIGTPLNVIGGRAETLLRKLAGFEPAEKNLRIITTQIDRISRIVGGMLDFARVREPRLTRTDVAAVIRRVLELLEERFREDNVLVEASLSKPLPLLAADADQLQQVFLNVAVNALDAMPAGGTLLIRGERIERSHPQRKSSSGAFLAIAFEDTGAGISPEHLARVFEPFFTTKEVGKGTGLGLSLSYGIVREHGGWIDLESRPERGTRITIYLPVNESCSAGPPARAELTA